MKTQLPAIPIIKSYIKKIVDVQQGNIAENDLFNFIEEENLSDDEIEVLYKELKRNQINIIQEEIDTSEFDNVNSEDNEEDNYSETSEEDLTHKKYEAAIAESSASDLNLIQVYCKDIGRYDTLSPEEELVLAKKIAEGDEEAKKLFINSNLRLVINVAKSYMNRGVDIADLIQEGNLGLLKAMEKYDYKSGFKFSTYAIWWIRQRIVKYLKENGKAIKIPIHISTNSQKIKKVIEQLSKEKGRDPTYDEIAQATNIPEEKIVHLLNVVKDIYSIDMPLGNGEKETTMGDYLEDENSSNKPEDVIMNEALQEEINKMLDTLTEREKAIIVMRYGLNNTPVQTLEYIGNELGITRERVRQIEKKVLRKLRHPSKSKYIKDFL